MREKIKGKLKKILPIALCLVMVFGSCITTNAAKISAPKLESGNEYLFGFDIAPKENALKIWKSYLYKFNNVSINDVKAVAIEGKSGAGNSGYGIVLTSLEPFSIEYASGELSAGSEGYYSFNDVNLSSANTNSASSSKITVNGNVYYVRYFIWFDSNPSYISNTNLPLIKMSDYVDGTIDDSNALGQLVEKMHLADFTWNDGKPSVYASEPTGSIEPPKNLSIYRGYSSTDRQYKFQIQWDKPSDTNLNVEVMYNIHWKDGVLGMGSHIYKKYLHITNEDGMSAQNNKLTYLEDDFLKAFFESENMELPSVYNITEIYVRFSKEIDGIVQYSLWRKIEYTNLDEGNGYDEGEDDFIADSSTGAFDTSDNWIDQSVENGEIVDGSDKENARAPGLDADGNNITPPSSDTLNPDTWDEDVTNVFKKFSDTLKSAFEFMGDFPSMISEFFGFLPSWIIGCITLGILMAIILRIIGR